MFLFQQYCYNMKHQYEQTFFNAKTKDIVNFTCCQGLSMDTFYLTPPPSHQKWTDVGTEKFPISIDLHPHPRSTSIPLFF